MSEEHSIIHLNHVLESGQPLEKMDLDPADFQGELPDQFIRIVYENAKSGLNVGIWTTTSMQEAFGPYPGDEFMHIIDGKVAMVDADGNETPVEQGGTFCVRNGIPVSWKQRGFLQKFFIVYANPDAATPSIDTVENGIFVLNRNRLTSELSKLESAFPFEVKGEQPVQRDAPVFENDNANMHVGMWDSEAFESEMQPFPCHEFVQLLEGSLVITEKSGKRHAFAAGDVFFIPMGTECTWLVENSITKFYCMLTE